MPEFLTKVKQFEKDCEDWDANHPEMPADQAILPEKKVDQNDSTIELVRPDRDLINLLDGLPKDSVERVSP